MLKLSMDRSQSVPRNRVLFATSAFDWDSRSDCALCHCTAPLSSISTGDQFSMIHQQLWWSVADSLWQLVTRIFSCLHPPFRLVLRLAFCTATAALVSSVL